jgi:hypothetical protein
MVRFMVPLLSSETEEIQILGLGAHIHSHMLIALTTVLGLVEDRQVRV